MPRAQRMLSVSIATKHPAKQPLLSCCVQCPPPTRLSCLWYRCPCCSCSGRPFALAVPVSRPALTPTDFHITSSDQACLCVSLQLLQTPSVALCASGSWVHVTAADSGGQDLGAEPAVGMVVERESRCPVKAAKVT